MVYRQDTTGWTKIYEYEHAISDLLISDDRTVTAYSGHSIYNRDGLSWERQPVFRDLFGPHEFVASLHPLSREHVWMVSFVSQWQGSGEEGDEWRRTSKIYFYDGDRWNEQYELEGEARLFALDPEHAWAWAGKDVFFWNGESWKKQFTADGDIGVLKARDPGYAWAIGNPGDSPYAEESVAYFFDGSAWEKKGGIAQQVDNLEIMSDGRVWAWYSSGKGSYPPAYEYEHEAQGQIFCWSGSSWDISLDGEDDLVSVSVIGPDLAWATFCHKVYMFKDGQWQLSLEGREVSALSACDERNAWCIVNDRGPLGNVLYYDGISWEEAHEIQGNCREILVLDASHVWAVSHPQDSINENGYLVEKPRSVIYFFNGGVWEKQLEVDTRIDGMRGEREDEIWAFGGGMVYVGKSKRLHMPRDA